MTDLTAGKRLRSNRGGVEIIVVRPPATPVELWCGGQPMTANLETGATATSSTEHHTVLGKRYIDIDTGLEVLCTKAGPGVLTANGSPLTVKAPSALPASD